MESINVRPGSEARRTCWEGEETVRLKQSDGRLTGVWVIDEVVAWLAATDAIVDLMFAAVGVSKNPSKMVDSASVTLGP